MNVTDKPSKSRGQVLVDLAYYAVWVAAVVFAVWITLRWLAPFLLAFVTAALLQRPVRWLTDRTGASRGFLAGVLVVLTVAALAAVAGGVGWWMWRQAVALLSDETRIRAVADRLAAAWHTVAQWCEQRLHALPPTVAEALRGITADVAPIGEWLLTAAGGVVRFATRSLPSLAFSFLVWMIATVFLTADYRRTVNALTRHLPSRAVAVVADLRELCGGTVKQMARAYLALMGVTFLELCVGLWLLRVHGAVWLAALIALVDILPVLGVGSVLLPWAGVAALNGDGRFALCLLALYLVITVIRNLLEPHLISRRVGLPPIVTLLCLYVGWELFGLVGLLFLPFAVTVGAGLYRRKTKPSEG